MDPDLETMVPQAFINFAGELRKHTLRANKYYMPFYIEATITGSLGYTPLPHHEDSQVGLTRHLADMELTVLETERKYTELLLAESMFNLVRYEESAREALNLLESIR